MNGLAERGEHKGHDIKDLRALCSLMGDAVGSQSQWTHAINLHVLVVFPLVFCGATIESGEDPNPIDCFSFIQQALVFTIFYPSHLTRSFSFHFSFSPSHVIIPMIHPIFKKSPSICQMSTPG